MKLRRSYFDGVKFLMDNEVQTRTYTLMMLCGAELGRDKAIKDFGMKSKWRDIAKTIWRITEEQKF